jgi:hypothetical protein
MRVRRRLSPRWAQGLIGNPQCTRDYCELRGGAAVIAVSVRLNVSLERDRVRTMARLCQTERGYVEAVTRRVGRARDACWRGNCAAQVGPGSSEAEPARHCRCNGAPRIWRLGPKTYWIATAVVPAPPRLVACTGLPTAVSTPVPAVIVKTVTELSVPLATYRYWPDGSTASPVGVVDGR